MCFVLLFICCFDCPLCSELTLSQLSLSPFCSALSCSAMALSFKVLAMSFVVLLVAASAAMALSFQSLVLSTLAQNHMSILGCLSILSLQALFIKAISEIIKLSSALTEFKDQGLEAIWDMQTQLALAATKLQYMELRKDLSTCSLRDAMRHLAQRFQEFDLSIGLPQVLRQWLQSERDYWVMRRSEASWLILSDIVSEFIANEALICFRLLLSMWRNV